MSWLNEHLETFVKPQLGFVPTEPLPYFSDTELTIIKNAWRSVKRAAQGKQILLAGRDVFVFEVLARRENYPTQFIPQCSRVAAKSIVVSKDSFLFDTGFVGSVPRELGLSDYKLLSFAANRFDPFKIQIFPRMTGSRGLALKIEGTPKYWMTGRVVDGAVVQDFTPNDEFERAAKLTIAIYKNSAPKFCDKSKVLGGISRRYTMM